MFLCTVTLSFCTLADPMASVAATLSVNGLSAEDEAPRRQKILVGCILGGTAYTLVATGGINSVKGMFTLVGLLPVSYTHLSCALDRCVAKVKEMIGWDEKYPRRAVSGTKVRGVGLAMACLLYTSRCV